MSSVKTPVLLRPNSFNTSNPCVYNAAIKGSYTLVYGRNYKVKDLGGNAGNYFKVREYKSWTLENDGKVRHIVHVPEKSVAFFNDRLLKKDMQISQISAMGDEVRTDIKVPSETLAKMPVVLEVLYELDYWFEIPRFYGIVIVDKTYN
jgi:hypothetical protein